MTKYKSIKSESNYGMPLFKLSTNYIERNGELIKIGGHLIQIKMARTDIG